MKFSYKPKTKLEKFGIKVYSALVENFSQTFFVGGMVRDLLLSKKVNDVDIATEATPDQVAEVLRIQEINYSDKYKNFGSIMATFETLTVEITTLRKDLPSSGRYPKISFVKSPKIDSKRRDFTINSLYLKANSGQILDFYKGALDIKTKTIKFIGQPNKKIMEDPLRIIRALRFSLSLNFIFEKKTFFAIKNNFSLVNNLTKARTEKEILKLKNIKQQKNLREVINSPKTLDKYFKYR